MSSTSGTIAPVEGDIYYYETMQELDAHEVDGDRRRAKQARMNARLLGLFLLVAIVGLLVVFRSSLMLQLGSVIISTGLLCAWYLYDLLELCDD